MPRNILFGSFFYLLTILLSILIISAYALPSPESGLETVSEPNKAITPMSEGSTGPAGSAGPMQAPDSTARGFPGRLIALTDPRYSGDWIRWAMGWIFIQQPIPSVGGSLNSQGKWIRTVKNHGTFYLNVVSK